MFKLLSFFLLITIQFTNAEQSHDLNFHNDSSSFLYLNLTHNQHRIGFETFFWITNLFIDNYFIPKIPTLFYNQTDYSRLNEKLIDSFGLDDGVLSYAKIPFKVYPSLTVFTIICFLVAISIPIIGLSVCFYRCCCKSSKFNPFDRKTDSFFRKVNSFFMFIILTAILLATITLFFTNQNSSSAVAKSSDIYIKYVNESKDYQNKKIPKFIEEVKKNLRSFNNKTSFIFTNSFKRLTKNYLKSMFADKNETNNLEISELIKEIRFNLTSNDKINLLETMKNFGSSGNKNTIDRFLIEINGKNSALNLLDIGSNLEKQIEDSVANSNMNSDFFQTAIDNIINNLPQVQNTIKEFSNSLFNETNVEYFKRFQNYYEFFYITLIGICLFVLFLFILFSFGLGGICARRKHKNIKQTCHRGLSANFLMSASVFYFLFAWIVLLASILLFVPGITTRHFVCKPLIELDKNDIFKGFIKNTFQMDLNFTRAFTECNNTGNSGEINSKLSRKVTEYFLNSTNEESISFLVESKLPEIRKILDKIDSKINENDLNKLEKQIDEFVKNFREMSQFIPEENIAYINLIDKIIEYLSLLKTLIQDTKNIKLKLRESQESNSFETSIKKELKIEISQHFLPELKRTVESLLNQLMKSLPSCQILSNLYKDTLVTGCFEYLDNMNTFWLTLLVTILLYLILIAFAISQSDLFRKNYPYDQITNESLFDESKYNYPKDIQNQSKHQRPQPETFNNIPIDAFEMENYINSKQNIHANHISKPLNRSPPPLYRDS